MLEFFPLPTHIWVSNLCVQFAIFLINNIMIFSVKQVFENVLCFYVGLINLFCTL